MFKIDDKIKCLYSDWGRIKVGKVYTVTAISETFVGFDITDDYPELKDDKYYNGITPNWPVRYRLNGEYIDTFELVKDKPKKSTEKVEYDVEKYPWGKW